MKFFRMIAICATGCLAWGGTARAGEPITAANPYTTIAVRNVFSLAPLVPEPPIRPAEIPLPKIVVSGWLTILGRSQALFKVGTLNRAGNPAEETWYVLGEGEREDDVAVVRIDVEAGAVTFDNHGTIQQIPLASPATTRATVPKTR